MAKPTNNVQWNRSKMGETQSLSAQVGKGETVLPRFYAKLLQSR